MEEKRKVLYEAPSTAVVEVKVEGIVCQSQDPQQFTIPGYGDAEDENADSKSVHLFSFFFQRKG